MKTKNEQWLVPSTGPVTSATRAGSRSVAARVLRLTVIVTVIVVTAGFVHADWRILDHPDAVQTSPLGISGNRVVGVYFPTDGGSHGFLYDGKTWTDLDYPGALYTVAIGVSGKKIVGSYYSDPGAQYYHGFLYDGKTWTTLDYPGAVGTHVLGIHGDRIVGYYWDGFIDHGFIYDGKTWTTLDYPGAGGTFVNGAFGKNVVGSCELSVSRGYLYDGSSFTLMDYPGASGGTWPWSISGDKVVGSYATGLLYARGFLHDLTKSTWTNLDFPNADRTVPRGIDGKNVVGEFETGGKTHGFLYTTAPDFWDLLTQATGWVTGTTPADGYGVVLRTTDGGQTWVRQGSTEDIPNVALNNVKALNRRTVWVVGDSDGGYGVILRTDDGGKTWVRQGGPGMIPDVNLHGVGAVGSKTAWVVGDQGTILRTDDGGKTWAGQQSGTTATLFEAAVINSRIAWIAGNTDNGYATIFHTKDGGRTWVRQGTAETLGAVAFIDLTAVNARTAWAVGTDGYVAKTGDGGTTWRLQMGPGLSHNNGVCGVSANTAWIATDYNVVYRTTDGGTTWNRQFMQIPGNYYLLGVSALGRDRAWVVGMNIPDPLVNRGIILHTGDGGTTWRLQTPAVNVPFRRVSFVGSRK